MIIICPECATRYNTTAHAIGPNGRTVRCANCEATWYVGAGDYTLELDNLSLADNEKAETGPMSGIASVTSQKLSGVDAVNLDVETNGLDKAMRIDVPGAHVDIRDRADRRRRQSYMRGVTLIWLVPTMLIGFAVLTSYKKRHDIVATFPKSATIFKSLGVEVSQIGLTLSPPETRYAELDGQPVLIVVGSVKNISKNMQFVPLISLTLHNSGGEIISSWLVELENPRLAPKSRVEFLSQFPNPPLDAVELKTRFLLPPDTEINETTVLETPLKITSDEPL
ncbi:MAG: MJ0042-type zinc finger domain-containing protein [Maricaulaceae bacterium]